MITLSCSSVASLLVTVHVDALPAGAQSKFAVAALLFITVFDNIFFFERGGFDSHLESLTFYFTHTCLLTAIVNKKTCPIFLLGD